MFSVAPFSFLKMTFVLQKLDEGQFLSPAIQTDAINKLTNYMTSYFKGSKRTADDKPTCAICFDMSGTGKTTTIMEASKNSGSIRAPISLIDDVLFAPFTQILYMVRVLNMRTKQDLLRVRVIGLELRFKKGTIVNKTDRCYNTPILL